MAGNTGNAWQETFLATISEQSGTDATVQGISETIDIDLGEKDFDQIVLGNGGRIEKLTPEGITSVTLEGYPLYVGSGDISAATSIAGFIDLLHAEDTAQPLRLSATRARTRYRLAIMWTDDTTLTSASIGVTNGKYAKRLVFADGFVTSVKPSFTDGILKTTVTFKVVPFDSAGTSNMLFESVAGTGTMTALQSYTSTIKF